MLENTASSSITAKKEMFLKLQKERDTKNKDRITPHEKKDMIPVSFMQEQILRAEMAGTYDPEKTRTVCPYLGYIIKGRINIAALHRAVQEVVKRQEILRTNYEVYDNQIYQVINDVPENILKVVDLNNLSEDERKNEADRITKNRASETFSLFRDKLMLSATLIIAKEENVLFIPTDHVATDGLSMGILQAELLVLLQSYSLNIPISLPDLTVKFSDYTFWEREKYSETYVEEKLGYWRQQQGKINNFLPYDHKIEPLSYDGGAVPVVLLPQMVKKLKELCQVNNVTMFTFLYAAFMELVHLFSGHNFNFSQFVVANRNQKETELVAGCFIDWQFLCLEFTGDPTFLELMERTKKTLFEAYDNYVPFGQLLNNLFVPELKILFQLQTFFDKTNKSPDSSANEEVSQPVEKTGSETPKSQTMRQPMMFIPLKISQPTFALFPLEIMLSEAGDTINGNFIYSDTYFNRSTIVNLTNDYILLLSQVIKNPLIRLSELKIKPHKSVVQ